jgi:hypothetical protein
VEVGIKPRSTVKVAEESIHVQAVSFCETLVSIIRRQSSPTTVNRIKHPCETHPRVRAMCVID